MSTTQLAVDVLAAGGVDSINQSVNNTTRIAQTIGGSLVALVVTGLGVSLLFGAFGEGGKLRQHLGKVMIAAVGALVLGGGAIVGPMLVNVGEDIPSSSTSTDNGGVN